MKKKLKSSIFLAFRQAEFRRFCLLNRIQRLALFGSRARGDARPNSDVDLLVKFKSPKSLLELVRIEQSLSRIVGKKVDLVTVGSVPAYLKNSILKDASPVYEER